MSMRKVPELNLFDYLEETRGKKTVFSKSLFEGLKDYGFIVLTGHPISEELLERSYELSKELFLMTEDQKKSYSMPDNGHQRGYTPFGVEHAKDSKVADLKEFWHVGREGLEGLSNFWPEEKDLCRTLFSFGSSWFVSS